MLDSTLFRVLVVNSLHFMKKLFGSGLSGLGNIGVNLYLGLGCAILQTKIWPDEPNGFAPRIPTGDLIQSQQR
jgi:hypothetical protein